MRGRTFWAVSLINIILQYHQYAEKYPNRISKAIKHNIIIDKRMLKEYQYINEIPQIIISFIEKTCRLVDGQNAGELVRLTLTQKYVIASIFGYYNYYDIDDIDDMGEVRGTRKEFQRVRNDVLLLFASGSGKSTLLSAINYVILNIHKLLTPQLKASNKKNYDLISKCFTKSPKIFIGSQSQSISDLCYKNTIEMIKQTPLLKDFKLQESRGKAYNKLTGGVIRAMSSAGDNHEGIIPSLVILDEIHLFKTGAYANNLKKNKTKNPAMLNLEITTQGVVRNGYLDERLLLGRKVLAGDVVDDRKLFLLYEQDTQEEIYEAYEKNEIDFIFKSNPNIGMSQNPATIWEMIKEMKDNPSIKVITLTKNFNIPQNPQQIFFSEEECYTLPYDENLLSTSPIIFIGLDHAFTRSKTADISVINIGTYNPLTFEVFKKSIYVFPQYFRDTDGDALDEKSKNDKIDYKSKKDTYIVYGKNQVDEDDLYNIIVKEWEQLGSPKIGAVAGDPTNCSNLMSRFNEVEKNPRFFIPVLNKQRQYNTPRINRMKDTRLNKKLYSNSEIDPYHFANAVANYDSNNFILIQSLIDKHHDDGVISELCLYTAIDIFHNYRYTDANKEMTLGTEWTNYFINAGLGEQWEQMKKI